MFKNIILGTDGSEDALKAASVCRQFVESCQVAKVTVLYVHKPFTMAFGYDMGEMAVDYAGINEALLEAGKKSLEATVAVFGDMSSTVEGSVEYGDAADVIAERAAEIGADLVVVGSRGLSGVTSLLMGSVSTKIVQTSPCPVLVVR